MNACLCTAALACATRALVEGEDPFVVDCEHAVDDDELLCQVCLGGLCGAVRYIDTDGVLVYEHVAVRPRLPSVFVMSQLGIWVIGMN